MGKILLDEIAIKDGLMIIPINFKDEDGVDTTPTQCTWSLKDVNGVIINSLEDIEVTSLGASIDIVLKEDDLSLLPDENSPSRRILSIDALYDGNLGNGLPIKEEITFFVE